MKDPKRKLFAFAYRPQKQSIGFLGNGFPFAAPWEEPYCDIDSSRLLNALCEKKWLNNFYGG